MKILMVQAQSVETASSEKVYPIGIVALATRLVKEGHEVAIADMNIGPDPFGALKQKLLDFRPEAVGLSLRNIDPLGNRTASLIPGFVAAVRVVAALLPEAWIIAGGTGFSLFPERLMQELPEIDYGFAGEAESTFPGLLSSLEDPPHLKGLCVRKSGRVKIIPPSREFDMSEYIVPDRGILDPSEYTAINSYVPAVGIESKRGCSFSCAYCVYPKLQGKKLRCRRPAGVVDEIEMLHKEYGIERFHFTDPVVNMPNGHLEDICHEILRRRLHVKWDGFMREDNLNEKNVALFERAGCECFSFSPDGLSQEALDVLEKRLGIDDVIRAAELVSKTDVTSVYHFMVNVPGETETTCEKGMRLLERIYDLHAAKQNLGTVVLNNIRILPGTKIERIALEQGVITPGTDLLYPTYYNPPPFDSYRYRLETLHLCRNIFMWQEIE